MASYNEDDADHIWSEHDRSDGGLSPLNERRHGSRTKDRVVTRPRDRRYRDRNSNSPRSILKNARSSHADANDDNDVTESEWDWADDFSVSGTEGIRSSPTDPVLEEVNTYDWTQNKKRYSKKQVWKDNEQANLEKMFGNKRGGRDRVVIDVNNKPAHRLREQERIWKEGVNTYLQGTSDEARRQLHKKITDKSADKLARDMRKRSELERFAVVVFDEDPSHYEVNVELYSPSEPGGVDITKSPHYIVSRVLKSLYDKLHPDFRKNKVHHMKRQLLARAIDEINARLQQMLHELTVLMAVRKVVSHRSRTRQKQMETETEEQRETILFRKNQYEVMLRALKGEAEHLNSSKVMEEDQEIERDRLADEKLMNTEQLRRVARRAQVDVPEFGEGTYYDVHNLKLKCSMLTGYNKVKGNEDFEAIQQYLRNCRLLIHNHLTPDGGFHVLSDFANHQGAIYKQVQMYRQYITDRGTDSAKAFSSCWNYIQSLADSPNNEAKVVDEIVDAMLAAPDQANQMHKWLMEVVPLIYDLNRGRSPQSQDIYMVDDIEDVMKAVLYMWWPREQPMIMEYYREWKRKDKPEDGLEIQETWKNTFKGREEELRVWKVDIPYFRGGERWMVLAKNAFNRRKGQASPKYEARRYNSPGLSLPPRAPSRSGGNVKQTLVRENDARSTTSQNKGGEGARYCFRCGNPAHFAPACDMYPGDRRETPCPKCPEKLKLSHSAAECKGSYRGKIMKLFKNSAIDNVDVLGETEDMHREFDLRLGLMSLNDATGKEGGEHENAEMEAEERDGDDPPTPDDY